MAGEPAYPRQKQQETKPAFDISHVRYHVLELHHVPARDK